MGDLGRGDRSNTGVASRSVERLARTERRAACLLGGRWTNATRRRPPQTEEALELAHVAKRGLCAVNAFDGSVRSHAALRRDLSGNGMISALRRGKNSEHQSSQRESGFMRPSDAWPLASMAPSSLLSSLFAGNPAGERRLLLPPGWRRWADLPRKRRAAASCRQWSA